MKNVTSVRLDTAELRRVREIARREGKDLSTVIRELMEEGWILRALREYRRAKISLGTLAERLNVPLVDAIDLLAELGVPSPMEYDDYVKSYGTAARLLKR
jgi:hypothetical protein